MLSKKKVVFPVVCAYCGVSLIESSHTWDHIVPRSKGGTNDACNLAHCCTACNRLKADKSLTDFLALIGKTGVLFEINRHHKPPNPTFCSRIQKRVAKLNEAIDLKGEIKCDAEGSYTYTPPRGAGVSKLLRQVLKAKGVTVVWLPLPSATR